MPTSRAAALSYTARRLRSSSALTSLATSPERGRFTRAEILGLYAASPDVPALAPVTEDEAMSLPPFGRGVALLANAIAGTDWAARREDPVSGLNLPLPRSKQPSIVTNPSPLQALWNYRYGTAVDGILYGNHFALLGDIDFRTQRPGWLVPLPADQVWIMTDPASPGLYQWVIGGEIFDLDEILHIPFGARSGEVLGLGVLRQYAEWLPGVVAAEQYSRDAFAAGALPPAVITVNNAASQTQLDDLKAKWRDIASAREPIVLPNGTVVTPIVGNALQAQLVEARTWNAQMVANAVGVPGWKLGLDGPTMTYQNVETGDIDFVRDSVDRYGRPIVEAFTKWLLPAGTELHWLYDSRMRADQKTQAEIYSTYVASGIMTVDEVRARLNLPPLPVQAQPAQPALSGTVNTADAVDAVDDLELIGAFS